MNVLFLFRRLMKMDYRRTLMDIRTSAQRSGRTFSFIAWDMFRCGIRYGAGPVDYTLFAFYDKTEDQRASYVTRTISTQLVRALNDAGYRQFLDSKSLQCRKFSPFMKRDWMCTAYMNPASFARFCQGKQAFLYKPDTGSCGKGIRKYLPTQDNLPRLFEEIASLPAGVLEEVICQHTALSELNPGCVNTVRLVTILQNGVYTPVCAVLRMGRSGSIVDNLNSGGIAARIDLQTGLVSGPAADKAGNLYECHPDSRITVDGFQIPLWDQVLSLGKALSQTLPQMKYVGWDIAIRQEDVIFVEGNWLPGHDIMQLPAFCADGYGILPAIRKAIFAA